CASNVSGSRSAEPARIGSLTPHPGRSSARHRKSWRPAMSCAQLVPAFEAPCTNRIGAPRPDSWIRRRSPVGSSTKHSLGVAPPAPPPPRRPAARNRARSFGTGSERGEVRLAARREAVPDLEAEREAEVLELAHVELERLGFPPEVRREVGRSRRRPRGDRP